MDCKEKDCGGWINDLDFERLPMGNSFRCVHACVKCGRLYNGQGESLFDGFGNKLFRRNGKIVGEEA